MSVVSSVIDENAYVIKHFGNSVLWSTDTYICHKTLKATEEPGSNLEGREYWAFA